MTDKKLAAFPAPKPLLQEVYIIPEICESLSTNQPASTTAMTKALVFSGIIGMMLLHWTGTKPDLKIHNANQVHSKTASFQHVASPEIKDGDLIFQTSLSGQSKAIQLATKSKYSHCGIIYQEGKKHYVFEAIQPVRRTPLNEWIARGQHGKYVIKRLKNADQVLTVETLEKMKQAGESFNGKNYDLSFEWSDEKIYCSELIWKVYQRGAGIEIGKLEKLSSFDLTNEVVRKKMRERYGPNIPMDETVISPAAIFDSELLVTIKSN